MASLKEIIIGIETIMHSGDKKGFFLRALRHCSNKLVDAEPEDYHLLRKHHWPDEAVDNLVLRT